VNINNGRKLRKVFDVKVLMSAGVDLVRVTEQTLQ
jgi:hypothetical protein